MRLAVDLAPRADDRMTRSEHDSPSTRAEGPGHPQFSPPPAGSDAIGQLGPYLVVKPIGMGGMGFVFEARDPQLERRVAVKVLNPQLASDPRPEGDSSAKPARRPRSVTPMSSRSTASAKTKGARTW